MTPKQPDSVMPSPRQLWGGKLALGLTGGIGCGKSTVAELFAARGVSIIDTDLIAHALTAPNGAAMPAIAAHFGSDFIQSNGALDRAKMRAEVFGKASAKRELEAILHPMIGQQCTLQAQQATGQYLIFAVPLLVESGHWQHRVERVLVIDCSVEQQISRVMARNHLSAQQVQDIIATQATRQARLAVADDVIENTAGTELLAPQVEKLHQFYLSLI